MILELHLASSSVILWTHQNIILYTIQSILHILYAKTNTTISGSDVPMILHSLQYNSHKLTSGMYNLRSCWSQNNCITVQAHM